MHWLKRVFASLGIEAYGALSIEDVKLTRSYLLEREEFDARSVLLFLVPYYAGETENLSRYAAARDYHIALREIGERLICAIKEKYPQARAKCYGDHSPIAEASAALKAGLGVLGDNGLIIHEKYGSYVFIGDVITDLDPALLLAEPPREVAYCEHCGACKRACPTGILRGEGEECLSAITQRKGSLSEDEIALMRKYETVWGCDLCQSACPHNQSPARTPIPFFHEDRIPCLTRSIVENMSEEEFSSRAFAWRGKNVVLRNLSYFEE